MIFNLKKTAHDEKRYDFKFSHLHVGWMTFTRNSWIKTDTFLLLGLCIYTKVISAQKSVDAQILRTT